MIDYRDLPPADVELPRRESYRQTFLRHFADCPRSAYLDQLHNGGAPSHQLLRGSAAHWVFEQATNICVQNGEIRIPPEIVKDLVNDALEKWPLPPHEADALRIMAFHWAEATVLDLNVLAGVESKFRLEIEGETVTGTIDRLELRQDPDWGVIADVIDYKTSLHQPNLEDFSQLRRDGTRAWIEFQGIVYALGVVFGTFENGASYGDGVGMVRVTQVFPRYMYDEKDGLFLAQRHASIYREELLDWQLYLRSLVRSLQTAYETRKWQAVPSNGGCQRCPAAWECPIPDAIRDMHGIINSDDDALEGATQWEFLTRHAAGLKRELKAWSKSTGKPIRFMPDMQLGHFEQNRTEVNKESLIEAAKRSAEYGEPLRLEEHVKTSTGTRFDKMKVSPEQQRQEAQEREEAA
jgi:hypothetical protein